MTRSMDTWGFLYSLFIFSNAAVLKHSSVACVSCFPFLDSFLNVSIFFSGEVCSIVGCFGTIKRDPCLGSLKRVNDIPIGCCFQLLIDEPSPPVTAQSF